MRVVLLTSDAASRAAAAADGLEALHPAAYARELEGQYPELRDLVARVEMDEDGRVIDGGDGAGAGAGAGGKEGGGGGGKGAGGGARASKRKRVYEQHRPAAELAAGVAAGRLHQGALRVSRFNPFEGWVASQSVGGEILVSGRIDMNRALDGDVVAVELLPEEQWRSPSKLLPGGGGAGGGGAGGGGAAGGEEEGVAGGDEGDEADAEAARGAAGASLFEVAPGGYNTL